MKSSEHPKKAKHQQPDKRVQIVPLFRELRQRNDQQGTTAKEERCKVKNIFDVRRKK